MHNKSFTVDNQVTLIGGRNMASEYFGANYDKNLPAALLALRARIDASHQELLQSAYAEALGKQVSEVFLDPMGVI